MGLFELDKTITIKGVKFTELTINDKNMFEEYLFASPFDINVWCMNFTYTSMFSESRSRKVLYKIIDEMLCIFVYQNNGNTHMLYYPLGNCDKKQFNKVLMKCMKIMYECNDGDFDKCLVRTVTEPQLPFVNTKYFKSNKTGFGYEHTYNVQGVASLSGKDYAYVRRKVNKFQKEYPNAIWREYRDSDWGDMMTLKSAWEETAGEKYFRIIDASYYIGTIKNHQKLDHKVFVVEHNNRIIGMISGGYLSPDKKHSWCFLRKPLNNFEGLSEFIIHKLCCEFKDFAVTLNDGGDGGAGGLRFFKERFHGTENQVYVVKMSNTTKELLLKKKEK